MTTGDVDMRSVDGRVRIGEMSVPLWVAVVSVAAMVAALVAGVMFDGKAASEARIQQLEQANTELKTRIDGLTAQVTAGRVEWPTNQQFTNTVSLDRDVYFEIGPFWQVTGLELRPHAQGVALHGRLLGRLMVNRQNMEMRVDLYSGTFQSRGSGNAVLNTLVAGRYSPFEVIIPTEEKVSDVRHVRITLDHGTGTTSSIF